ncbi:hypothetical protein ACFL4A_02720 [bacterium]
MTDGFILICSQQIYLYQKMITYLKKNITRTKNSCHYFVDLLGNTEYKYNISDTATLSLWIFLIEIENNTQSHL